MIENSAFSRLKRWSAGEILTCRGPMVVNLIQQYEGFVKRESGVGDMLTGGVWEWQVTAEVQQEGDGAVRYSLFIRDTTHSRRVRFQSHSIIPFQLVRDIEVEEWYLHSETSRAMPVLQIFRVLVSLSSSTDCRIITDQAFGTGTTAQGLPMSQIIMPCVSKEAAKGAADALRELVASKSKAPASGEIAGWEDVLQHLSGELTQSHQAATQPAPARRAEEMFSINLNLAGDPVRKPNVKRLIAGMDPDTPIIHSRDKKRFTHQEPTEDPSKGDGP